MAAQAGASETCLRDPEGEGALRHEPTERGLHDHLCETTEERALWLLVALLAVGVAVAHADQRALAGDLEADEVACCRNRPPLLVQRLHFQNRHVLAVGVDLSPGQI